MKTKKKSSIQVKALGYLLTFNIVIIILLWICEISIFDIYYEKTQLQTMSETIEKIRNTESDKLDITLHEIVYNNDICIALTDEKNYIATYNTKMNGCGLTASNSKVADLMLSFIESDDEVKSYKFVNEDKQVEALLYGVKYSDENYIFLYSNLQDLSTVTLIVKRQIMYICIMGLLVAIIISIFLANKLTDPITRITKKAKKLGNGDYDVTFDESDITEIDELAMTLTQAKQELAKTDELRRDLMANVSHDLKTPLTMIKAYAEMIRDISHKDKEKMNEHLNIIVDETDRLTVLVNDILELSKMQSKASALAIEEFDLCEVINTILQKYQIIKETEKYKIEVNMPEKALVKADKKKIEQVIYNLINNAINYTGDDKHVTINVKKDKKSFLVEIKDTGKGIKKEEIPYIWDKYYKKDKKHQRNVISTGLGLSIVKQILEQHHFEYGVKSVLKKGSTFYFKIKT